MADKCLGKLPARGDARTLNFARFVQLDRVPRSYDPWKTRAPFPARSFGNSREGCCTVASRAIAAMRFERIETRATPHIDDAEVHRVYRESVMRHYGTDADAGMYEVDSLSDFRKPEYTFKDTHGHPITIDAFTSVNERDIEEVKAAIALSGKFGIKACFNLPLAFEHINPPEVWDVPAGQQLTGDWTPGTWGGHSTFVDSYDATGPVICHSWWDGGPEVPYRQRITWKAWSYYADEAYWCINSVDDWRKKTPAKLAGAVDIKGIAKAINAVSSQKLRVSAS
jgi:hypothetical protein